MAKRDRSTRTALWNATGSKEDVVGRRKRELGIDVLVKDARPDAGGISKRNKQRSSCVI